MKRDKPLRSEQRAIYENAIMCGIALLDERDESKLNFFCRRWNERRYERITRCNVSTSDAPFRRIIQSDVAEEVLVVFQVLVYTYIPVTRFRWLLYKCAVYEYMYYMCCIGKYACWVHRWGAHGSRPWARMKLWRPSGWRVKLVWRWIGLGIEE